MPTRETAPEKPITTTIAFDRATYKQLRLLAVERETNVRDLIRDAVRLLLAHAKSSKGR